MNDDDDDDNETNCFTPCACALGNEKTINIINSDGKFLELHCTAYVLLPTFHTGDKLHPLPVLVSREDLKELAQV